MLEAADFDLERLVAELCGLVSDRAAAKNLELIVDTGELPTGPCMATGCAFARCCSTS